MGGHSNQSNASFGSLLVAGQPVGGSVTSAPIVTYPAVTTVASAGHTLTVAETLSGIVNLTNASPGTVTLPVAAGALGTGLIAGIPSAQVGTTFTLTFVHTGATTDATIAVGTGGTLVGSATVTKQTSGTYRVVVTAVGTGSSYTGATYTIYRI